MRRMFAVVALVVVAAGVGAASPAGAGGGSQLAPDRESYHPGDVVHLSGVVTKLDREWHGPYTVKVHSYGGTVPGAEEGIPVGRLVVTRLDDLTVRAEVTFVLPKLPDGGWSVSYCSPGCDRSLGDLSGGYLLIGDPPPPPDLSAFASTVPPVPVTTAPTTAAPASKSPASTEASDAQAPAGAAAPADLVVAAPTVASEGTSSSPPWWVLGGLVAAAAVAAALVAVRRRDGTPRRSITSSSVPPDDGNDGVVEVALDPSSSVDETIGAGR